MKMSPGRLLPEDLQLADNGLAIPRLGPLSDGDQSPVSNLTLSPLRTFPRKKKKRKMRRTMRKAKRRRFSPSSSRLLLRKRGALLEAMRSFDFQLNKAVLVSSYHRALVVAGLRRGMDNRSTAAVEGERAVKDIAQLIASSKPRTLFGETIDSFEAAFAALDRNNDGSISIEEFTAAFRRLDLPKPSDSMIAYFDSDGNGEVDFLEFLSKFTLALEETGRESEASYLSVEEVESLQLLLGVQKGCVRYGLLQDARNFKRALLSRPKVTSLDTTPKKRNRRRDIESAEADNVDDSADEVVGTPVRNIHGGELSVVSDEEKLTGKMVNCLAELIVTKRRTLQILGKT